MNGVSCHPSLAFGNAIILHGHRQQPLPETLPTEVLFLSLAATRMECLDSISHLEDLDPSLQKMGCSLSPRALRQLCSCPAISAFFCMLTTRNVEACNVRIGSFFGFESNEETAVTDGQSEVSVRFAQKIGLLPEKASAKNVLFPAWQFRAVLPMDTGQTAFCKGMLIALQWRCFCVWWSRTLPLHTKKPGNSYEPPKSK